MVFIKLCFKTNSVSYGSLLKKSDSWYDQLSCGGGSKDSVEREMSTTSQQKKQQNKE